MVSAIVSSPSLANETEKSRFAVAPPSGFEQLEAERELVLDVYYGGKKRGTARVAVSGNRVEFMDARQAMSFIDDAEPHSASSDRLQQPFDANRQLACGLAALPGCGYLETESVGIILDEDRFRIDLFVSPSLRTRHAVDSDVYLAPAQNTPSLVSLFGGTVSGSTDAGNAQYRLQNRTIAAFGSSRVRSDMSIERNRGVSFDSLVAESDRGDWRASAGQFWVPGSDLVSRRKVIGAGVATQFDTRRSKEQFYGTPVEVFLGSPARVEVFVDGRLVASQILSAGNRVLDTARWPSGSYDAVLRIYEQGRAPREEQRFFSRDEALAPLGHPMFQLFGGVQTNGSNFHGAKPFAQGAVAYRLTEKLGVRAMAIAGRQKIIADISGTFITPVANFTAGALASSKGDAGLVVRGYTTALKGVAASFDLRKMHTRGQGPLLPASNRAGTYDQEAFSQYDQGDFLQITGQLSARVQEATVRFSGYFRSSPSSQKSYSFGPSIDWPVIRHNRFSVVAEGDAHKTNQGFSSYAGIRLLLTDGPRSLAVRGGMDAGYDRPPRLRGEVQGSVYGESNGTQWSGNAAIGRNESSTYARAGGDVRAQFANGRGEVLKEFGSGTQYSLTAETGVILTPESASLAGGSIKDSALVVMAHGDDKDALDVFVNQAKAGTASAGHPLVVYLEPYREYEVQARPHNAAQLSADFSARRIATYPGSVSRASWEVSRFFVAFGRLVSVGGAPLRSAKISGPHGVAESDDEGYFQVETSAGETLNAEVDGSTCTVTAPAQAPEKGYLKWGDTTCR